MAAVMSRGREKVYPADFVSPVFWGFCKGNVFGGIGANCRKLFTLPDFVIQSRSWHRKKPSLMDFVRLGTMAKELADYAKQIGIRPIAEAAGMLEDEARTALAESVKSGADLSVLCAAAAGSPAPTFPAAPPDDGPAVPESDKPRERKQGTPIRMATLSPAKTPPPPPSAPSEGLAPGIRPADPPGTPAPALAPPPGGGRGRGSRKETPRRKQARIWASRRG